MRSVIALAALPLLALAKTDLAGCTSSAVGASLVWWDPTNGEVCEFLDCGGGRAPPKTTVPGCAAYKGTATYEPKYLPGWSAATTSAEHAAPTMESKGSYPVEETSTSSSTSIEAYATASYPVEETPSSYSTSMEIYPTASISETTTYAVVTQSASLTSIVSGTGSIPYPTGTNGTITTGSAPAPAEQTGAANAVRVGFAGLIAGVLGMALL